MPIYEYKCKHCGELFEMFRSISASGEEVSCPVCGKTDAKRELSAFSCGSGASGGNTNHSFCGG
ncbi:zinc ribbon domain-containing protein [Chloroflexota bacterium]